MQLPILQGVWTDGAADMRTGYPVNMVPVIKDSGLSKGYLRPADGIVSIATGPGICRGGINWNGTLYRVMGTKLVSISAAGVVTTLGDVGGTTQVSMDYGFDRICVASNGGLFYWTGTSFLQVTDTDLGTALDVVWADGYYVTTDGTYIVVTDLSNPLSVNPLKYGTSDIDPDPVVALKRLRGELYAINRYTIEVFQNTGGSLFPFTRIPGATITRGAIGTHAVCLFADQIAFIGSARAEAAGVWLGAAAQSVKISSREIDVLLKGYTDAQLALCLVESRNDKGNHQLWVHLPDRTAVYDLEASIAGGIPVWFFLTSSTTDFSAYRAQNLVWANNVWNVGDTTTATIGTLSDTVSSQWGNKVRWEFSSQIVYADSNAVIFHRLELHALTGRIAVGADPRISTSFSVDGMLWSEDRSISAGKTGDRIKNLVWFRQGWMRNWRIQRFRGDSDSFISIARLEATLEPLAV